MNKRVLSIQSHVVHGYVGNKAAVFPLQLLGFDVDFVNSVNFSCHTGYKYFPHGEIMNGVGLLEILKGLELNGLLEEESDGDDGIGSILTGYIGNKSFLEAVVNVIRTVREYNPRAIFFCDPVLGDDGRFYVPEELVDVYRKLVIPIADCVTPNKFETEKLTGISVKTINDAIKACEKLHRMGPSVAFITSAILEDVENNNSDDDEVITIIASKMIDSEEEKETYTQHVWTIDCPLIPGSFTGTGDVTASLFLAHMANQSSGNDLGLVMEKVINTMYILIRRTYEAQRTSVRSKELRLIQSKDIIEKPPSIFKAKKLQ